MLTQTELKSRIVLCPAKPLKTYALEQAIRIGTGFHNKWYRSQKEHWLGWITVKEYQALVAGKDPEKILAKTRWNSLNCLPMMFWLAEVSQMDASRLEEAANVSFQAARRKVHDCAEHGGAMRKAIPWEALQNYVEELPASDPELVQRASVEAYDHLVLKSRNSAK